MPRYGPNTSLDFTEKREEVQRMSERNVNLNTLKEKKKPKYVCVYVERKKPVFIRMAKTERWTKQHW